MSYLPLYRISLFTILPREQLSSSAAEKSMQCTADSTISMAPCARCSAALCATAATAVKRKKDKRAPWCGGRHIGAKPESPFLLVQAPPPLNYRYWHVTDVHARVGRRTVCMCCVGRMRSGRGYRRDGPAERNEALARTGRV